MSVPYRWVIVATGGLMGCVAIGSMFSLPVFLSPIAQATGWSRTGLSTAMTINFLALAVTGFGWGILVDRFGPRLVVLSGGVLLGLGIALASRSQSLVEFQLVYGLLVGAGAGAIFAPLMATVTGWFDTQRSLAVSLVSAGMGIAPMTVAPLAARLVSIYDWRTFARLIAILAWAVLLPAALLVRRAPAAAAGGNASADDPRLTAAAALRSPQFIVLALTYFFCCATHSGPIFHTVSYAISCGLPAMVAVSIYSVEGLAGLGGRLLFGVLGDRFGAEPVLVAGLLVQALGAGAYFFVREIGGFYAVAALFGLAYAGVMPLYAVIARENFPMHVIGTVFGAATYGLLYIGSFGMGLGAVAIMLTFRPTMPAERGALAPAT
jgi:MFS family permease